MKKVLIGLLLVLGVSAAQAEVMACEDYQCDSLAVREMIISNGIIRSVNQVTEKDPETGRIVEVNMVNLGLTHLPPEVGNLTALKSLQLAQNDITEIPSEIENLDSLAEFAINSNKLNSIPPEIGMLSMLEQLYISANSLVELPSEIGSLSQLRTLAISNNSLTELPAEIGNLGALRTLLMRNNHLTSLPETVLNLLSNISVDVDNNKLCDLPANIQNWLDYEAIVSDNWEASQDCSNPVVLPTPQSGLEINQSGSFIQLASPNFFGFQLLDVDGSILKRSNKETLTASFDVSNLNSGVYLLRVITASSNSLQKLVIHR